MLTINDFPGLDETIAHRVLAYAFAHAPGLEQLEKGSDKHVRAVAILSGVAQQVVARGSGDLSFQSVGNASVKYAAVGGFFTEEDKLALRALVQDAGAGLSGLSRGRFPQPGALRRMGWED